MLYNQRSLQEDAEALKQEVEDAEGDIDFFLTADWPAGVAALCPPGSAPEQEVAGLQLLYYRPLLAIARGSANL